MLTIFLHAESLPSALLEDSQTVVTYVEPNQFTLKLECLGYLNIRQ
jgi:hypothetical protein